MTQVYGIRLPWPHRALSSNARVHWARRARTAKDYRADAKWAAMASGLRKGAGPQARLEFAFFPPNRRKRDAHNMPHMMKPAIDGIADAMGCDDALFECVFPARLEAPVKGGSVRIWVTLGENTPLSVPRSGVAL